MEDITPKEMRDFLKNKGIRPLQSNADVIVQYNEFIQHEDKKEDLLDNTEEVIHNDEANSNTIDKEQVKEAVKKEVLPDNFYTYVGSGATPPPLIKFMGRQVFRRGEPTEVKDKLILSKIKGNPCFVKGRGPSSDEMYDADMDASEKETAQNNVNQKLNNETKKQYAK